MPAAQPNSNRNAEVSALVPMPSDLWPGAYLLSSIVLRSRVKWANVKDARMVGMLYKDWELADDKLKEDHGDWVFGDAENLSYSNETMQFYWMPPLTDEQKRTPVKVTWDTKSYNWPSVLRDLVMVLDETYAADGVINSVPVQRRFFVEGGSFPTDIERRVFASNTDWKRYEIEKDVPYPTEIMGDYHGRQVHIEPCLHPRIHLDSIMNRSVLQDCVPERRGERVAAKRVLEATNHTEWQEHVFDVQTKEWNGMFFRIELIAHPPEEPPITVR